jgi:hypothetical protein
LSTGWRWGVWRGRNLEALMVQVMAKKEVLLPSEFRRTHINFGQGQNQNQSRTRAKPEQDQSKTRAEPDQAGSKNRQNSASKTTKPSKIRRSQTTVHLQFMLQIGSRSPAKALQIPGQEAGPTLQRAATLASCPKYKLREHDKIGAEVLRSFVPKTLPRGIICTKIRAGIAH